MLNALLTRLREKLSRFTRSLGKCLAKAGLTPNILTLLSLASTLTGFYFVYASRSIYIFMVTILLSGFLDVADGAVARYTGRVTSFGGFLDSTVDRVNDFFMILALKYIGYSDYIVYPLLIVSFLISYVRARAEAEGLRMEGVGFIERAERIVFILTLTIAYDLHRIVATVLAIAFLLLSLATLLQRIAYAYRNLR